jgi:hypothetical protein
MRTFYQRRIRAGYARPTSVAKAAKAYFLFVDETSGLGVASGCGSPVNEPPADGINGHSFHPG